MNEDHVFREGFWYSKYEPDLPMPVANPEPWEGQDTFLAALEKVEGKASCTAYRGWSNCRLCQKFNGNEEHDHKGWSWPAGFRHYVAEHNVRPTSEFILFILNEVSMTAPSLPEIEKNNSIL